MITNSHQFIKLSQVKDLTTEGVFADHVVSFGFNPHDNGLIEISSSNARHLRIREKLTQFFTSRATLPQIVYFSRGVLGWSLFEVANISSCPQDNITNWPRVFELISHMQDSKRREVREFFAVRSESDERLSFFVHNGRIKCETLLDLRAIRFLDGVGYFAARGKELVHVPLIDIMEAETPEIITGSQNWKSIFLAPTEILSISRIKTLKPEYWADFNLFLRSGEIMHVRLAFEGSDAKINLPRVVQSIHPRARA